MTPLEKARITKTSILLFHFSMLWQEKYVQVNTTQLSCMFHIHIFTFSHLHFYILLATWIGIVVFRYSIRGLMHLGEKEEKCCGSWLCEPTFVFTLKNCVNENNLCHVCIFTAYFGLFNLNIERISFDRESFIFVETGVVIFEFVKVW